MLIKTPKKNFFKYNYSYNDNQKEKLLIYVVNFNFYSSHVLNYGNLVINQLNYNIIKCEAS